MDFETVHFLKQVEGQRTKCSEVAVIPRTVRGLPRNHRQWLVPQHSHTQHHEGIWAHGSLGPQPVNMTESAIEGWPGCPQIVPLCPTIPRVGEE